MYKIPKILTPQQYFQVVASLTASIVLISDGMQYSWSSPTIPLLQSAQTPVKISQSDVTWLEGMYLTAGLASVAVTPLLVDKVGRQKSILLASGSSLIAWAFLGLATHKVYLYIGRFIAGVVSDLISVAVPMYISEIADKNNRGFLLSLVFVMSISGVIGMYSLAPFTSTYVPAIAAGSLLVFQLLSFSFMPESPYFLISKNKSAVKALEKLKGIDKCDSAVEEISKALNKTSVNFLIRDIICRKSTLKALLCVTIFSFTQHFCGLSVILMNLHTILQKANSAYVDHNITAISFALVELLAVVISSFTVDKFGRRTLLMCSSTLTGISLTALAIYFQLESLNINLTSVSWLPVVFVMLYAAVFNLGLGLVPKIMTSELFSPEFKAIGMTYADAAFIINGSLSIILYNYLIRCCEMYVPFYIFSGISFITAFLARFITPETKGRSLQEIQAMLEA